MSLVLRSDDLPPDDRIEIIRDAIWTGVLPVEIDYDRPGPQIEVLCRSREAGPVNFSSARSTPTMLRRTPALARQDHDPKVFLAVQVSGTTMVAQGDNQAVLRAGDMAVYDSTRPYTVLNTDPHRAALLPGAPPRARACRTGRSTRSPGCASDRTTTRSRPSSRRTSTRSAAPTSSTTRRPPPSSPARASTCSARSSPPTSPTEPLAAAPLQGSLVLRVQEYVRDAPGGPRPVRATIAAAHHVSVRHLYAELERAGIGLQDTDPRAAARRSADGTLRDPRPPT